MGNLGRIKKMLCCSGLEVWQKKRYFRGKSGKVNREKIRKGRLVSEINPEFEKKKDAKKTANKKLSDAQATSD